MTEILDNAKMLLGIADGSADEKLTFYINDITEAIKAHCRIEFLPVQLYGLAAQMAARLYENELSNVRSITEGERRVEFELGAPSIIDDYGERLRPFINRAGRLPSEVVRGA